MRYTSCTSESTDRQEVRIIPGWATRVSDLQGRQRDGKVKSGCTRRSPGRKIDDHESARQDVRQRSAYAQYSGNGESQEEILTIARAAVTTRLRAAVLIRPAEMVEAQQGHSRGEGGALQTANE